MSNHSSSYLINDVIWVLREQKVFDLLEHSQVQQLVIDITKIAVDRYDCNSGEILVDHASFLKICCYCVEPVDDLSDDGCLRCRKELGFDEE